MWQQHLGNTLHDTEVGIIVLKTYIFTTSFIIWARYMI